MKYYELLDSPRLRLNNNNNRILPEELENFIYYLFNNFSGRDFVALTEVTGSFFSRLTG
jgi:hypothetical protein